MRRRKNSKIMLGLLVAIVALGVGYAAIAGVNLLVNGTATLKSSDGNFSVRFVKPIQSETAIDDPTENAITIIGHNADESLMDVSGMSATVEDDTHATFNAGELDEVGEYVEFTYTVVNESDRLDAALSFEVADENDAEDYFEITKTVSKEQISKGETATVTVKVKLIDTPKLNDYAATFSVTLNATAEDPSESGSGSSGSGGNEPVQTFAVQDLKANTVTEGDGLYDNGDGTYTYKGSNPANYLSFAGNLWRIVGIDSTGIKIISEERIDLSDYSGVEITSNDYGKFDSTYLRDSRSNGAGGTYCTATSYGCNVWSKDYSPAGEYANKLKTGTVLLDSELKIYLNGLYLTDTLEDNSSIVEGIYNVGPKNNETAYTWAGKVALLTNLEYDAAGGTSSYLNKQYDWWLLTPNTNTSGLCEARSGGIYSNDAAFVSSVRPVLYLSSDVSLTGTGTDSNNAFTIIQ